MTDSQRAAQEIVEEYLGMELRMPFDDAQDFYAPPSEELRKRIQQIIDKWMC